MPIKLKTEVIQVRVSPDQLEKFREMAEADGRRVSEWLRELARREAAKAA